MKMTRKGYIFMVPWLHRQKHAQLWPLKVHFFLAGAGLAPVLPFLPVIGKQMGIPGHGVGFILALVQSFGLIVK